MSVNSLVDIHTYVTEYQSHLNPGRIYQIVSLLIYIEIGSVVSNLFESDGKY